MNHRIRLGVQYCAEDYARAAKYLQQRNYLARYAFLAPMVLMLAVLIFLFLLDRTNFVSAFARRDNLIVLLVIPILTPILYFWSRRKYSFLVRRRFQKQIESSPALQQPQQIILDDEGIEGKTLLGSGITHWDAIIEAVETNYDFYFFTGKTFATFVPKRAIEDEGQENDLRKIVIENLGSRAEGLRLQR